MKNIYLFLFTSLTLMICIIIYLFVTINQDSFRLGNLLDAWYFGSLGCTQRIRQFATIQRGCGRNSFGGSLRLGQGVTLQKNVDTLVENSYQNWAIYSYNNIQLALPEISQDFRNALDRYVEKHSTTFFRPPKDTLVIQYRLGDFVKLGQLVHTDSIVKACLDFHVDFSNVWILDGGVTHESDPQTLRISLEIRDLLQQKIQHAFPRARVQVIEGTTDSDFYVMSEAPFLVTAGGSFAICGAIANTDGHVRTPSCKNLNFPQNGKEAPRTLTPRWKTYDYEIHS